MAVVGRCESVNIYEVHGYLFYVLLPASIQQDRLYLSLKGVFVSTMKESTMQLRQSYYLRSSGNWMT